MLQAKAMAMVPLAALSVGSYNLSLKDLTFGKLVKAWKRFADTANYAEILPPLGSQQLSYAKFLELLSHRQIKRIILMDNATCAIVEVGRRTSNLHSNGTFDALRLLYVTQQEWRHSKNAKQFSAVGLSTCQYMHQIVHDSLQCRNAHPLRLQVPVEGYAASYRYPLSVDRIDET